MSEDALNGVTGVAVDCAHCTVCASLDGVSVMIIAPA